MSVEVKSSDNEVYLQDILLGNIEQVNWQIECCMFVFKVTKCKLFTVLDDETGHTFPTIHGTKVFEIQGLIENNIKKIISNYVNRVVKSYFRSNLKMSLSEKELNLLIENFSQYGMEKVSNDAGDFDNRFKESNLMERPKIWPVCYFKYLPFFKMN